MTESPWTNRPWVCITKWVCESLMTGPFHKENKIGADVTGSWSFVVVFLLEQDSPGKSWQCLRLWECPCGWRGGSLPDLTLSPSLLVSGWPQPAFGDAFWKARSVLRLIQLLARSIEKIPFTWKIHAAANRVKSFCPLNLPKDQHQLLAGHRNHRQDRHLPGAEWLWNGGVVTWLVTHLFPWMQFSFPPWQGNSPVHLLALSRDWFVQNWKKTPQ